LVQKGDFILAEEKKRTDLIINGNTATWSINMSGDIQGLYLGTFTFRCYLMPSQHLAASREYRQLLGDHPGSASQHDDDAAFSLAQLKHRILTAPPFWYAEVPDHNVLMAILEAAVDSEVEFRAQAKAKRVDALAKALKTAKGVIKNQAAVDEGKKAEGEV
jgi:hypothetical protein